MRTIAFFDLFDYPPTAMELWRYGRVAGGFAAYEKTAAELAGSGRLGAKEGFYFLPGRENTAEIRLRRYNYAERKFRRARLSSRIFKYIPWIRLIAVGNMMGTHNLRDDSDIDLFIITEPDRIWISRLFAAGIADTLGWRPRPGQSRDKICLSFFLSEAELNLRGLMLSDRDDRADNRLLRQIASLCYGSQLYRPRAGEPADQTENVEDVYFIHWLAGLVPIYDAGGVYEKFIRANIWLKDFLPNWGKAALSRRWGTGQASGGFYRDSIDLFCGGLEYNLKRFQLKRMPEYLARPLNKDSRVLANDRIIKLHANDRREEYRTRYLEKIKNIN